MKSLFLAVLIPLCLSAPALADNLPDEIKGDKYNGGMDIVRVGVEDKVEYIPYKVTTRGKETREIQIGIPIKVAPQWRQYFVASFVSKYASTLNKYISDEMEFCFVSEKPNDKLADQWEAQEIVLPAEVEDFPDESRPKASDLVNNLRINSWEYRALAPAKKDYQQLKKKLGTAR